VGALIRGKGGKGEVAGSSPVSGGTQRRVATRGEGVLGRVGGGGVCARVPRGIYITSIILGFNRGIKTRLLDLLVKMLRDLLNLNPSVAVAKLQN
jgi:hypothetical protein